jgi:[NiFe] hydrogenase diaphorase moiety small subunit
VDTEVALTDKALEVCPVGVILKKRVGFATPIGERRFDVRPISEQALADAPRPGRPHTGECAACETEE